jgi:adenylate cyclase
LAGLYAAQAAKFAAGEAREVLRLTELAIELADGDPTKGDLVISSPLVAAILLRGLARGCLGLPEWKDDFDDMVSMSADFDATLRATLRLYKYGVGLANGWLRSSDEAQLETAEILTVAERSGDDFAVAGAQFARAMVLMRLDESHRTEALDLIARVLKATEEEHFTFAVVAGIECEAAKDVARQGDLDTAIETARRIFDRELSTGEMTYLAGAAVTHVELLLQRRAGTDLEEAQSAIERLSAVRTDPGYVLHDMASLRLRAQLANAQGNTDAFQLLIAEYREKATAYGFDGCVAMADAMTHQNGGGS